MKIFDYADLGDKRFWHYSEKGITPEDEGIKPISVTDKAIKIGELLIIGGTAYTICCMSGKGGNYNTAYAEKIKNQSVIVDGEDPEEQYATDEITCPYCECEIESFEMQDEDDNYECPFCRSIFSYQREVSVTYSSQPVRKREPVIV